MTEALAILLFLCAFAVLLSGFPVAFCLAGTALIFAGLGVMSGVFDWAFLAALPERLFGIMMNDTLMAVPMFVFMGVVLERAKIAEDLLETMADLFHELPGGLGISVCLVGGILAASTGIVGATVVTMGLISLPTMLKRSYDPRLATGIICASGTLGQIIPPSIVLIVLGDVIGSAHQQAQLAAGNFSPSAVSVGDLFVGALVPGVILMSAYVLYVLIVSWLRPQLVAQAGVPVERRPVGITRIVSALLPPALLIFLVLGSIIAGVATATEAASVGAMGALLLATQRRTLNLRVLREVMDTTLQISTMVFTILIGASVFSLVFRGFGGDDLVRDFLMQIPGGLVSSFIVVMLMMFVLGFFLDFFEITFVVVPLVGPVLLGMGLDPIWLGVMIALNLQTSFLTPPFGFSLFYLRGAAPESVRTGDIYRGVLPFILIQLGILLLLWFFPALVTWLPALVFA